VEVRVKVRVKVSVEVCVKVRVKVRVKVLRYCSCCWNKYQQAANTPTIKSKSWTKFTENK
jgi:hypothetical protein